MSEHTAGPWHRNIRPATKYTTVWSGRNKHVAYVATTGLSEEEVEGNISLIAASPDMLKLLETIDATWGEHFDQDLEVNGSDMVEWFFGTLMPEVRKEIAKARRQTG